MSTLKALLKDVPVEWRNLGELANLITTGRLNANAMEDNGAYPFFTCNEKPYKINSFAFDLEALLISGNGSQVGHLNYYNGKFNAYQRTYVVGEFKEMIYIMYVYHYLNFMLRSYIELNSRKGSVPYITMPMLQNLSIPIPHPNDPEKSLAIQQEIVRVLDGLNEQNKALTGALAQEIDQRKKQYEYYREELFRFEGKEVAWKTLGEVSTYSKKRCNISQLNETNYVGVDNLLQNRAGKTTSKHLPNEGNFTSFNYGDVLIGNIRPYLKKIWFATCEGGASGDVLVIQNINNQLSPKYLYQILADDRFFNYNMTYAKGAKMPRGDKSKIMEYKIPIPFPNDKDKSLQEQERIVHLLDQFDEATKNIVTQLEKEIELRNKQYEFYRNFLLSFPKENK